MDRSLTLHGDSLSIQEQPATMSGIRREQSGNRFLRGTHVGFVEAITAHFPIRQQLRLANRPFGRVITLRIGATQFRRQIFAASSKRPACTRAWIKSASRSSVSLATGCVQGEAAKQAGDGVTSQTSRFKTNR